MESKLSSSVTPTDNFGDEIIRPCANFAPSLWNSCFSSIITFDDQTIDRCLNEVEELKIQVRCRLTNGSTCVKEKLGFIDILERIGISYLFQGEIEDELNKIHVSSSQTEIYKKEDLSTVSLYFRLLRQHGFQLSSEIFDGFKDENGFKNLFRTDVKCLLNLYEAAQTRFHGEDILEEALVFAYTNLEIMIPHLPTSLAKLCLHTFDHPFNKCIPRLEAPFFISLYQEEEEEESENDSVFRLAQLDRTLLQILYRKELVEISRWWKELIPKYPYARDRMVELYFWAAGVHFEPQYSLSRVMFTKALCLITISDDTYDTYGTTDELKAFAEAVRRWDISEIDGLPEYMKALYKSLLQLYVSFEEELQTLKRSYAASYSKERMIEVVQSQLIEAKWFIEGHIPSFEKYMEISMVTSTFYMLTTISLLGMESATTEAFQWLKTNPTIMIAGATICRIANDIVSYDIEKKRGQNTTGIDCYMTQYGVTKEEAIDELKKIAENAWKDLNEGCFKATKTAPENIILIRYILNLTRIGETTYNHKNDGITNSAKGLKAYIIDMFVNNSEI